MPTLTHFFQNDCLINITQYILNYNEYSLKNVFDEDFVMNMCEKVVIFYLPGPKFTQLVIMDNTGNF